MLDVLLVDRGDPPYRVAERGGGEWLDIVEAATDCSKMPLGVLLVEPVEVGAVVCFTAGSVTTT